MDGEHKDYRTLRPDDSSDSVVVEREARRAFDEVVRFCSTSDSLFRAFEQSLLRQLFALGCLLVRLFLACRHERLKAMPPLGFRQGEFKARRTLKTLFGKVTFIRSQMIRRLGGTGFYPLDAALGLTRDGFSPWVIQFVTRLASRMSFASSRSLCRSVLGWSPSVETIEELALGLGRLAEPFTRQQQAPEDDGEVLVIEVDGKCPPTAREGGVGQASGQAGEARKGVCVRLSASSRPGQATAAGQQETPEKRGQEQERQGSGPRRDVYAEAWQGRSSARPEEQEGVGVVRRS
jgi:hypothetical protein